MVTVGVTGHRNLINQKEILKTVDNVLLKILETYYDSSMRVISPIAKGADRLVVKRAIELFSAQLIIPLPFKEQDYIQDFDSGKSNAEFTNLINIAETIIQLPELKSRDAGYLAAGLYTLNHCDVLIALWDGQLARGIGGTAQIVAQARKQGKPMVWVQVEGRDEKKTSNDWGGIRVQYERFPIAKTNEDNK